MSRSTSLLSSAAATRPTTAFLCSPATTAPSITATYHRAPTTSTPTQQVRHATFVRRPRRPYTFTQLVQLSDGSSYVARTTSPQPLYRTGKDSRNTLLWQPSEKKLRNVEVDEAGKLAAFRERFGRAFDQKAQPGEEGAAEGYDGHKAASSSSDAAAAAKAAEDEPEDDGYGDLISSYAPDVTSSLKDGGSPPAPGGKKKK
ncbi:mitochondrial 54S ribosomal protein YmL36 [Geosmithia morbida]|uniref:Mitochondrial 54S ribosomal protein YmL36 n=1 Tax=Geosmithia morbida TaxID=1094350 RepID=A0A9P4YU70_9HYPO|nr:mitochondrial 54S ribosomal protein YmL36 [Geosmithia morbida]KAF4121854.1 mitochondrial 54S ribosomal protein YmL36 [Geosmithia morbida]